jgi:hypothetical protein
MASCVGFYFLIIRPFNVMRILFGMKIKKDTSSKPVEEKIPTH